MSFFLFTHVAALRRDLLGELSFDTTRALRVKYSISFVPSLYAKNLRKAIEKYGIFKFYYRFFNNFTEYLPHALQNISSIEFISVTPIAIGRIAAFNDDTDSDIFFSVNCYKAENYIFIAFLQCPSGFFFGFRCSNKHKALSR